MKGFAKWLANEKKEPYYVKCRPTLFKLNDVTSGWLEVMKKEREKHKRRKKLKEVEGLVEKENLDSREEKQARNLKETENNISKENKENIFDENGLKSTPGKNSSKSKSNMDLKERIKSNKGLSKRKSRLRTPSSKRKRMTLKTKTSAKRRRTTLDSIKEDEIQPPRKPKLRRKLDSLALAEDKNPYDIMGLPRGSSLQTVRKKFLELSKKHHPDKNHNKSNVFYSELTGAYNQIKETKMRRKTI
eukprot:snap_masked-scaffold_41-processed-gene-2.59-mRNA-1 protein AED:1.00 eAED:1.00 QI:0/-1/0/0/-1/1/1/0/244